MKKCDGPIPANFCFFFFFSGVIFIKKRQILRAVARIISFRYEMVAPATISVRSQQRSGISTTIFDFRCSVSPDTIVHFRSPTLFRGVVTVSQSFSELSFSGNKLRGHTSTPYHCIKRLN